MLLNRANVYLAEPAAAQHAALVQWVGACRYVYNLGLEQRRDFERGRRINYVSQARELTEVRAEVDWLKAAPVHALQNALRALEHAFQRFFAGSAAIRIRARSSRTTPSRFRSKMSHSGVSTRTTAPSGFPRS